MATLEGIAKQSEQSTLKKENDKHEECLYSSCEEDVESHDEECDADSIFEMETDENTDTEDEELIDAESE